MASPTLFSANPRKLGLVLAVTAVGMSIAALTSDLLTLGDKHANLWPVLRQFTFSQEGNLANLFQGLVLMYCALLSFLVGHVEKQNTGKPARPWLGITFAFAFLGIDEIAQIHEQTIAPYLSHPSNENEGKGRWMFVYVPVLLALSVVYFRWFFSLPMKVRINFFLSGCIYVGGAVVVESIGAHYAKTHPDGGVTFALIDNLSELMESAGMTLFAFSLMTYLAGLQSDVLIHVQSAAERPGNGNNS